MASRCADFFHTVVQPTATEFINDSTDARLAMLASIVLYHMADYWHAEHCSGDVTLNSLRTELIR